MGANVCELNGENDTEGDKLSKADEDTLDEMEFVTEPVDDTEPVENTE